MNCVLKTNKIWNCHLYRDNYKAWYYLAYLAQFYFLFFYWFGWGYDWYFDIANDITSFKAALIEYILGVIITVFAVCMLMSITDIPNYLLFIQARKQS